MIAALRMHTMDVIKYWQFWLSVLTMITFALPARFKRRQQVFWVVVLLLCGAKGWLYEWFGGHAQSPVLPETVLWVMNWAGSGLVFLLLLSLVWWTRKGRAVLLPAIAWGLAAVGQYFGTILPEVREVELRYENLPESLDGFRIAHVSDLHCSHSARGWRTEAVVDIVNRLNADMICMTGDYVDGACDELSDDLLPITKLRARCGVYFVRGNHEYYLDSEEWRKWFAAHGLRVLSNECVFPCEGLAVGGVNDRLAPRFGDIAADVGEAFAAATNGEFRVLLDHRPIGTAENAEKHNVRLQLSGHTHGGIAPGLSELVKRVNGGAVRGIYRVGDLVLNVSPGCGMWAGFPVRFFDASEITLITLKR